MTSMQAHHNTAHVHKVFLNTIEKIGFMPWFVSLLIRLFQVYTIPFNPIEISFRSSSIEFDWGVYVMAFQSDWAINPFINWSIGCM